MSTASGRVCAATTKRGINNAGPDATQSNTSNIIQSSLSARHCGAERFVAFVTSGLLCGWRETLWRKMRYSFPTFLPYFRFGKSPLPRELTDYSIWGTPTPLLHPCYRRDRHSVAFFCSTHWRRRCIKLHYRGVNKGLYVLLSSTQAGPGRTVKQEQ